MDVTRVINKNNNLEVSIELLKSEFVEVYFCIVTIYERYLFTETDIRHLVVHPCDKLLSTGYHYRSGRCYV